MHKIFCFKISLFYASTCFEHHVLIIRSSKFYYTASGIITPVGGRPVHSPTCAPDGHLQVWWYQMLYNTILTSWWWAQQCSKHVEAYNKLIVKQKYCASSWLITKVNLSKQYKRKDSNHSEIIFLHKCFAHVLADGSHLQGIRVSGKNAPLTHIFVNLNIYITDF